MLSHKNNNKNQSFIFEEELDQTNKLLINTFSKKTSKQDNLVDSLDSVKHLRDLKETKDIIIKVGGEDYKLEKENCGMLLNYLKDMKIIYDHKVNMIVYLF